MHVGTSLNQPSSFPDPRLPPSAMPHKKSAQKKKQHNKNKPCAKFRSRANKELKDAEESRRLAAENRDAATGGQIKGT